MDKRENGIDTVVRKANQIPFFLSLTEALYKFEQRVYIFFDPTNPIGHTLSNPNESLLMDRMLPIGKNCFAQLVCGNQVDTIKYTI